MKFWEYIESTIWSGWCNTVISGLLQNKGSIIAYIDSLLQLFGYSSSQGNCTAIYFEKASVSPSPDIFLYICWRDIDEITLKKLLDTFALQPIGTNKHLFIFEPSLALISNRQLNHF